MRSRVRRSDADATANRRAKVSCTSASVGRARRSSPGANATADRERSRLSSTHTDQQSTAAMLAVPRPTTRAECLEEARPCPWVGCKHHLLLEVEDGGEPGRPPRLLLNRPSHRKGPRRGLSPSAPARVVERWIDDAIELLFRMRRTCVLDVLDDRGARTHRKALARPLNNSETAELLNVRKQTIRGRFLRARSIVRRVLELGER